MSDLQNRKRKTKASRKLMQYSQASGTKTNDVVIRDA